MKSAPTWSEIMQRSAGRGGRRRKARGACGVFGVVSLAVVLFGDAGWEMPAAATLTAMVVTLACFLVLLVLREDTGTVQTGRRAGSAGPRDPEKVLEKVRGSERGASLGRGTREDGERGSRGGVIPLRPDIWALYVQQKSETEYWDDLEADLTGRTVHGAPDELTLGTDLEDARDTAAAWVRQNVLLDNDGSKWIRSLHPKWWVRVLPDGTTSLEQSGEKETQTYEPESVPLLKVSAASGDSAGMMLFLAYTAELLGVHPDPRYAVAGSGDMVGHAVDAVSGIEEKAEAALHAGACLMLTSTKQRRTVPLLLTSPPLVPVASLDAAATTWLTARGAWESAARTQQ